MTHLGIGYLLAFLFDIIMIWLVFCCCCRRPRLQPERQFQHGRRFSAYKNANNQPRLNVFDSSWSEPASKMRASRRIPADILIEIVMEIDSLRLVLAWFRICAAFRCYIRSVKFRFIRFYSCQVPSPSISIGNGRKQQQNGGSSSTFKCQPRSFLLFIIQQFGSLNRIKIWRV